MGYSKLRGRRHETGVNVFLLLNSDHRYIHTGERFRANEFGG